MKAICGYTRWSIGHAYLIDGKDQLVSTALWAGGPAARLQSLRKAIEGVSFADGAGIPGRVLEDGGPIWLENLEEHTGLEGLGSVRGVGSVVAFPIRSGDRMLGVLEFFADEPAPADESLLETLAEAGSQVGRAVERGRTMATLRENEERLKLAARASNDVIWDWDIGSGSVWWSESLSRVLHYSEDEVGSTIEWWYERIHPDERERVTAGIQKAIRGIGEAWSDEYRFLRGDGSYATVLDRATIVRGARGEPTRLIGAMADVSERRGTEEVHRLLARASGILTASLDGGFTFSPLAGIVVPAVADCFLLHRMEEEGRLRRLVSAYANPESPGVLLRGDGSTLVPDPEDKLFGKAIRTGEPVLISECGSAVVEQLRAISDVGRVPFHSVIVVPLAAHERTFGAMTLATSASGRRYGLADLPVAEDLANRIALALDNADLYEKMQQAVRIRDEVLAVVSHDLRNPLNAIKMGISMLLDSSLERRSDHVDWLRKIDRGVDQMNAMIDNLVDASKIEAGTFSLNQSPADIGALVESALELFRPIADQKGIRLLAELPAATMVWLDADQILRVLSNLLANALKFTAEGGEVRVRAEVSNGEARFAIADTGPGIPEQQLPRVFERYWQARPGDRRGAGLGLSIARGIVEAHGGRIWVESIANNGTTFFFTVPLKSGKGRRTLVDNASLHRD